MFVDRKVGRTLKRQTPQFNWIECSALCKAHVHGHVPEKGWSKQKRNEAVAAVNRLYEEGEDLDEIT